jgi:transposase-like protein
VIERLNEEFRRRVKTQGALPTEDATLVLAPHHGHAAAPPRVGRMTHRAFGIGARSTGRPMRGIPKSGPSG